LDLSDGRASDPSDFLLSARIGCICALNFGRNQWLKERRMADTTAGRGIQLQNLRFDLGGIDHLPACSRVVLTPLAAACIFIREPPVRDAGGS
jgi:hypothetical protein